MKENFIKSIVKILMFIGLLLIAVGIGLIIFTNLENASSGILLITSFLGVGIFIVLPTKIYLTIQALKKNDEKLRVN